MSLYVRIKKKLETFELDVEFEAGKEVVGFLGASGCGKSLTLRCIAGVMTPDEGRIVVNDRVFFDSEQGIDLSPQERKTALLFQSYQLFPNFTVAENIEAGMDRKLSKEERHERVEKYLDMFDLRGFGSRYPLRLSGGQQQRVALARMLAAEPDILMLDEPFSALDAHLKASLEQNMLDVFDRFDGTILYVSHDIDEAYRLCDRIAVVSHGRIGELDTAERIVMQPSSIAGLKLSGCKSISHARRTPDGMIEAIDWGIVLDPGPDRQIPDDLKYIGAREHFMHQAKELKGRNRFELTVRRVTESRFDCRIVFDPPSGNAKAPIYWSMPKKGLSRDEYPKPGDVMAMHFDAKTMFLVTK